MKKCNISIVLTTYNSETNKLTTEVKTLNDLKIDKIKSESDYEKNSILHKQLSSDIAMMIESLIFAS